MLKSQGCSKCVRNPVWSAFDKTENLGLQFLKLVTRSGQQGQSSEHPWSLLVDLRDRCAQCCDTKFTWGDVVSGPDIYSPWWGILLQSHCLWWDQPPCPQSCGNKSRMRERSGQLGSVASWFSLSSPVSVEGGARFQCFLSLLPTCQTRWWYDAF